MTREQLADAIVLACVPGGRYSMEVLGKYIQASYGLNRVDEINDIKTTILAMINLGVLKFTDDFKIAKSEK